MVVAPLIGFDAFCNHIAKIWFEKTISDKDHGPHVTGRGRASPLFS
jgi:hypothetical protein